MGEWYQDDSGVKGLAAALNLASRKKDSISYSSGIRFGIVATLSRALLKLSLYSRTRSIAI